jgi:hypothetical protein
MFRSAFSALHAESSLGYGDPTSLFEPQDSIAGTSRTQEARLRGEENGIEHKASRRFVPASFGPRLTAIAWFFAAAVAVLAGLIKSEANAIVIALFFSGSLIWSYAFTGFSFLWQRRRIAEPMTPLPDDARLLSSRQFLWPRGLLSLLSLSPLALLIATTSTATLVALGGLFTGTAAASLWHARWLERTAGARGERWFRELRLRFGRRPPYFRQRTLGSRPVGDPQVQFSPSPAIRPHERQK